MPIYIYESHLGGIYFSDCEYDYDELYCEQCGDYDKFIGTANTANTAKEAIGHLAAYGMINIDDCGGYDLEYVLEQMVCFEETISLEEAIEIVRKYKEYFDNEEENNA